MEDNHHEKDEAEYQGDDNLTKKIEKYVAKPEVKELYSTIEVSAKVIDGANKTVEFLSKPEVKGLLLKRLPAIAANLGKLTKFASLLGPAGAALGTVVDFLAAFGLFTQEDPIMAKLNEISNQIKDLRDEVEKGFTELKTRLDRNLALTEFLHVINNLQSQLEIFEQNVRRSTSDPAGFYARLQNMVKSYSPHNLITDLKKLHNIIVGSTEFGDPLFTQLAKSKDEYEGDTFDSFMTTLFSQFHFVIALEIRAVRMLLSLLAINEQGPEFETDILSILKNLATQRKEYDPFPIFEWYFNFKLHGGYFEIIALKTAKFIYLKNDDNHWAKGYKTEPGLQGHFHILPEPCKDERGFLITCRSFPGECMQLLGDEDSGRGYVKTTTDIYDPQCQWLFHIKNMEEKIFKLSTAKWPDRYVYFDGTHIRMTDNMKDKGDDAHFKLRPFPWV